MSDQRDESLRSTADVTERVVVKGTTDQETTSRVVVKGIVPDDVHVEGVSHEEIERHVRRITGADAFDAFKKQRADVEKVRATLAGSSLYSQAARLEQAISRSRIMTQTISEQALQHVAGLDVSKAMAGLQTTSERVLQAIGTSSVVDSVQRIAESMDRVGVASWANRLDVINAADFSNKTVLGMMATEAKLAGYLAEHYKTVGERAAEMAGASERAMARMYESLPIMSTAAFIADQVTRLRELQTFPEQILAQFSPDSSRLLADVLAAQERMLDSRFLRERRQEEDEWRSFLRSLATEHGFDAKRLLALLPSPLGPLGSLARLHRAEQAVKAIDQLQDAWRGDDEKRTKTLQKWRKDALAELRAARRQAKAARFLPGSKGLRLAVPKGDESWAAILKRDPRWRNPTSWPWLLDRAFNVATFLANYVTSDRSRRRLGDKGRRRRRMANKVLDLTAEILNRWYRRSLFHDLDISPKQVKAAVSNRLQQERKSAKSHTSQ